MKYRDPSTGQFKDLTVKVSDTLPIGAQVAFGGTTPPTGWLICDGSAVSRATYADLFAVIGTSYGAGNGSTTFNLPSKKGRNSVGLDSTDTDFNTIGKKGGSKELQEHSHPIDYYVGQNLSGGTDHFLVYGSNSLPVQNTLGTKKVGTGDSGNLQPYEVDNWIIKAWQPIAVPGTVTNDMTSESTKDVPSVKAVKDYVKDSYSTDEIKTNKVWIDGKPIYRKVINFGALPNATIKNVSTGLLMNETNIINCYGVANGSVNNNKYVLTLPDIHPGNASQATRLTINPEGEHYQILIVTGIDRSNYTAYITLEYTKITD